MGQMWAYSTLELRSGWRMNYELTQFAHETFNGCESTVTSRQHSMQTWFPLGEQHRRAVEEVEQNH